MKILAVQNRMGIGDMVIFLPFIEAISKNFGIPVSILVKENSKAKQYLTENKAINKIIILVPWLISIKSSSIVTKYRF